MFKQGLKAITTKSPSDIVILSALRTPVTRSVKGGLAHMYPEELLASILKSTVEKTGIDKSQVDDILVGTVLQTLGGQKASAMAVKHVGFPTTTTINTINRQCSSSAQALSYMANTIRAGEVDVGIAAGVESMTFDYFPHRGVPTRISSVLKDSPIQEAQDVVMSMGITSENVASQFNIAREAQDKFAYESHQKAAKATESGHFAKEIAPVKARVMKEIVGEDGQKSLVEDGWASIEKDDGIRATVSVEKLSTLKPVFSATGVTTAGNASQVSDGASAVLITTRAKAEEMGIKPIARFITSYVAGVPSHIMGVGPAYAVPELLKRTGLEVSDIDIFELNEAFASQSLYCIDKIGCSPEKVNPFGGAIAIGHPLGATGGRVISTLLNGLKATNGELGVISMCTSTGQGYAALFVNE